MSSRAPHTSDTHPLPSSRAPPVARSVRQSSATDNTNTHAQKRGLKRPRGPDVSAVQKQNSRLRPVGTPPQQPARNPQDDVTYDVTALGPTITPALMPPHSPPPPGTPVFARMDPADPTWYPARISLSHHTNSPLDALTGRTYTVNWEPLESLLFSDDIPHHQIRAMVDPIIPPDNSNAQLSARSTASMHIMHTHQKQINMASQTSRHSTQDLQLAEMVMSALYRSNSSNTAYPYQQDEVFNAVKHVSKTIHHMNKQADQNPSQLPSGRQQIWHAAMTAKYTDMTSPDNRSIAHGVYIPRGDGRKSAMLLNNDPAAELQWLSQFSEDANSPFHNPHVSRFWSQAQQCGFDGTNRTPVLRRTPIEITRISRQHNHHSSPQDRKQCIANTKAIIASLQSSGHLITSPLPTYTHDIEQAKALGLMIGTLTEAQLTADWQYHDRTVLNTTPPSVTARPRTPWNPRLLVMLENPSRSTLFRNKRRKRHSSTQSSVKHWGLRHIRRGAHFAHCSGGTTWRKEAYLPSNWGATTRRCHGDHAAHNCGAGRKHPISAAGKKEAHNEAPSTFTPHWKHIIPASLYFSILAGANRLSSTPLQGKCAVHVGSGTGSMRRALQLTGLFVIGVDIEHTVETGTRAEHTSYVADYDSFEGRFGDMVEAAIHRLGFSRADVVLIAFDADCSTRSRMTSNMNGKCRDMVSGQADSALPDGATAHRRDVIDRSAVQWLDSILHSHSDDVCVANAVRWPCGPGGWGLSDEDAHVLLTSTPKWDDANTSTHQSARDRSRTEFRRDNHSRASLSPRPPNPSQAPIHTGTASP